MCPPLLYAHVNLAVYAQIALAVYIDINIIRIAYT